MGSMDDQLETIIMVDDGPPPDGETGGRPPSLWLVGSLLLGAILVLLGLSRAGPPPPRTAPLVPDVAAVTTITTPPAPVTAFDAEPAPIWPPATPAVTTDSAEYTEGFIYGYRDGYLHGTIGDPASRLDDRHRQDPRDRGYVDGYGTGHLEASTAYYQDDIYADAKASRLLDDALFREILTTGDLGLADTGWAHGRAKGTEMGHFQTGEEGIPIPELMRNDVKLSKATFQSISPYTVGFLLGYGEGISGLLLDGAKMPADPYARGTQLGFAVGTVTRHNGSDPDAALQDPAIPPDGSDPLGFEGGFHRGFDLGYESEPIRRPIVSHP